MQPVGGLRTNPAMVRLPVAGDPEAFRGEFLKEGSILRFGVDLPFNDALPKITVDPETYTVTADGEELRCEPLAELPLAQRYFLF